MVEERRISNSAGLAGVEKDPRSLASVGETRERYEAQPSSLQNIFTLSFFTLGALTRLLACFRAHLGTEKEEETRSWCDITKGFSRQQEMLVRLSDWLGGPLYNSRSS